MSSSESVIFDNSFEERVSKGSILSRPSKRPRHRFPGLSKRRKIQKSLKSSEPSNSIPATDQYESNSSKNCLSSWGLPGEVLAKYKKRGITQMFDWQVDCLSNPKILHENANLVYSAPTSAGKTLVAEILAMKTIFERKKKVLFILPFISVVREKVFYFQDILSTSGIRVDGFMGSYHPPGGFNAINVAICTIEKANSIINRLLEDNDLLSTLGAVIIDELHLLGDPNRGYLLELLLTKLLYMSLKNKLDPIQLIGMSATLPNLSLLAKWLNAELFKTDFRPIPLYEQYYINGVIFDKNSKKIRSIDPHPDLPEDTDNIIQFCLETIYCSCSVLIFCTTKNWCETLAKQISTMFKKLGLSNSDLGGFLREQLNTKAIMNLIEQLKLCPVGLDRVLKTTVSFGVGFHHAGLTMDERDIIEEGFRSGALRVLIATTTLSSGVNLPARRVIVRSASVGYNPIDILTYRQMIGRAGRMGIDQAGESILICQQNDKKFLNRLLQEELNPISSCLEDSGRIKRAILEIISSEVASTVEDLKLFKDSTLLAACDDSVELEDPLIESTVSYLKKHQFIRLQVEKDGSKRYIATALGKACLASSLPPEEGLILLTELEKARKCFVLESELHIIYLVTPYSACNQWNGLNWSLFHELWEKLPEADRRVGGLIGVNEQFIMKAMLGRTSNSWPQIQVHSRFYTALALQELVQEIPLHQVAEKYQCSRGLLQSLQQSASTFAGMVTSFCHQLGWSSIEILVDQFQDRLQFGVNRDLLDLMRISALNGSKARILYNAGIESLVQLAAVDLCKLENILHAAIPFETEHNSGTKKNVWISGKPGMTEREAAEILITEARDYLKYEIGLVEAKWDQPGLNISHKSQEVSQTIQDSQNVTSDKSQQFVSLQSLEKFDETLEKFTQNKTNFEKVVEISESYFGENTKSESLKPVIGGDNQEKFLDEANGTRKESKNLECSALKTSGFVEFTESLFGENKNSEIRNSKIVVENKENLEPDRTGKEPKNLECSELKSKSISSDLEWSDLSAPWLEIQIKSQKNATKIQVVNERSSLEWTNMTNEKWSQMKIVDENRSITKLKEKSFNDSGKSESLFGDSLFLDSNACQMIEKCIESENRAKISTPKTDNESLAKSILVQTFVSPSFEFESSNTTGNTNDDDDDGIVNDSLEPPEKSRITPSRRRNVFTAIKVRKEFSKINVIDVYENEKHFDMIALNLLKTKQIALSIACEKSEKIPVIGEKIIQTRSKRDSNFTSKFVNGEFQMVGFAVGVEGNSVYYFRLNSKKVLDFMNSLVQNKNLNVSIFDSKEQIKMLYHCTEVEFNAKVFDPNVVDWLFQPEEKEKNLLSMAMKYCPDSADLVKMTGIIQEIDSVGLSIYSPMSGYLRACIEAVVTWNVVQSQKEILQRENETFLASLEIEMQNMVCLSYMELFGFGIDREKITEIFVKIKDMMATIEIECHILAGRKFRLSSSQDVAKVLKLTKKRRVSTSKQVLEKINSPIAAMIIQWRKLFGTLTKLIYPLQRTMHKTNNRIHGTCDCHNATGRISMHEPSLQMVPKDFSIPIKDKTVSVSIRSIFVPHNQCVLLSADYCQLELRILAHFSQDKTLCRVMRSNDDVFKLIASKWNKIALDQVDDQMRNRTKQLIYAIIYGMGAKTLAGELLIDEIEAIDLMNSFKAAYPKINVFINETIEKCRELGYVETLGGRRRYLPNITHKMAVHKGQAERQAVNTTIQGSAADIAKKAMVRIEQELRKCYKWKLTNENDSDQKIANLVLHLHDELVYEVSESELNRVAYILRKTMENVTKLSVPLPVKVRYGRSWGELKSL